MSLDRYRSVLHTLQYAIPSGIRREEHEDERRRKAPCSFLGRAPAALRAPARGAPYARAARGAEWGVRSEKRLTREQKKALTRERLIEAAARAFARGGFAATSLDEVAEEAGLTKGAVYSNFDSKEDLVRAVLEERLQTRLYGIPDTVPPQGTIEEDAARASEQMGAVFSQERDAFLLAIEFAVYAVRNADFRDDFTAHHREAIGDMTRVIEERLG